MKDLINSIKESIVNKDTIDFLDPAVGPGVFVQFASKINRDLKNHTSFLARRVTANTVYINLGKFTGDNSGGKAIITISGNPYWGGKADGGFRVLTLSSNTYSDISSTDIHTGASLYDFGQSNYTGTEIIEIQTRQFNRMRNKLSAFLPQ